MSKKKSKDYTPSSGLQKHRRARRRIKILERKVKRWDRYRAAGKKVSKNNSKMNRAKNWDTSGLKKSISFLKTL